jgi:hypothetical protein
MLKRLRSLIGSLFCREDKPEPKRPYMKIQPNGELVYGVPMHESFPEYMDRSKWIDATDFGTASRGYKEYMLNAEQGSNPQDFLRRFDEQTAKL